MTDQSRRGVVTRDDDQIHAFYSRSRKQLGSCPRTGNFHVRFAATKCALNDQLINDGEFPAVWDPRRPTNLAARESASLNALLDTN